MWVSVSLLVAIGSGALALALVPSTRVAGAPDSTNMLHELHSVPSSGRVGEPAPDFEWTRQSGEAAALSSLHGKAVVLNFWASWCLPCRTELPRLDHAAQRNPKVAFVAVDIGEDPAMALALLARLEIEHLDPVIDAKRVLPAHFGAPKALPVTYFLDADGTIRSISLGELDDARLAAGLQAATGDQ